MEQRQLKHWFLNLTGGKVVSRVHPTFHFSAKSLQISAIQQLALRGYSETAQITGKLPPNYDSTAKIMDLTSSEIYTAQEP